MTSPQQHHQHLLHLTYIRAVIFLSLCGLIVFALSLPGFDTDLTLIIISLSAMLLLLIFTYLRLHSNWPVIHAELFSQLCADAILCASLLYPLGGASNPFIFLLLIPLLITAATLNGLYTSLMALIVAALYTILLRQSTPLEAFSSGHHHALVQLVDLHRTGLWLNFILTALLISLFIVRMRQTLQQQEAQLQQAREQRLRDEQLLMLASVTAGTAHELGTPLSTLKILLQDLAASHPELDDLPLMQQQVELCSQKLHRLVHQAAQEPEVQPALELIETLLDEWQLLRPEVHYQLDNQLTQRVYLLCDSTLPQALLNLLNNAADACPENIKIKLSQKEQHLTLSIQDAGPGIRPEQLQQLGTPFITTRAGGLGIGLFLSVSSLERHQGEIRLYSCAEGGTLTEVRLPLQSEPTTHLRKS